MSDFGVPAFVPSHKLICSPPKKGSRGTMKFRLDAIRERAISNEEWDARCDAIDHTDFVAPGLERVEERRGGKLVIKYKKAETIQQEGVTNELEPNL